MFGKQRLHFIRGEGIKDHNLFRINSRFQPAFKHGATHLAGANKHQGSLKRNAHASPTVSSRLLSSAALAVFPAQQTYWTAG